MLNFSTDFDETRNTSLPIYECCRTPVRSPLIATMINGLIQTSQKRENLRVR